MSFRKFLETPSAKPFSRRSPNGKGKDVVRIADRIVHRRRSAVKIAVGGESSGIDQFTADFIVEKPLERISQAFRIGKETIPRSRRFQARNRQVFEILAQAVFRRAEIVGHRKDILGLGHN